MPMLLVFVLNDYSFRRSRTLLQRLTSVTVKKVSHKCTDLLETGECSKLLTTINGQFS